MIIDNTQIDVYIIDGKEIHVKREDLCSPFPGPSFSKLRGVYAHIKSRPENVIGVLDTYHSKAGWAVSFVCKALGKQAVDYWPRYKKDPRDCIPRIQQRYADDMGAILQPLQAGRSAILFHQAKKHLAENYSRSYMMPNALKLPESITENAIEAQRTVPDLPEYGTLVISISSGTVASGVLLGLHNAGVLDNYRVLLHMGYSRSMDATMKYMEKVSGISLQGKVEFIDENYGYADAAKGVDVPFPCNPYYDAKAWKWLVNPDNLEPLKKDPIIFWNIGD